MKDFILTEASKLDVSSYASSLDNLPVEKTELVAIKEAFEAAVKGSTLNLSEQLAEHLEEKVEKYADYIKSSSEELVEQAVDEKEQELKEAIDTYLSHIAEVWLNENKLQVRTGIKESLFDSLMSGMKTMFVEHNVEVPMESVDVVQELEEQLTEANELVSDLIQTKNQLQEQANVLQKKSIVAEKTKHLTESQVERVLTLTEEVAFDTGFDKKLDTIVSMVSNAAVTKQAPITESRNKRINTTVSKTPNMASFLAAARSLG